MAAKRYTAFISYAHADVKLAEYLKSLFTFMGHQAYFAPVALKEDAGEEFSSKVVEGISQSHCIVPIYTRNSLDRRWVMYELGVADAIGLPRFPVRVAQVSPEEANLPGKDVQIFKLFNRDDLIDLFTNAICLRDNPTGDRYLKVQIKESVTGWLATRSETDKIIKMAETRWIFIAGSLPEILRLGDTEQAGRIKTELDFNKRVGDFLSKMTVSLLEAGFSLTSCPQVQNVGKIVTGEAIAWTSQCREKTNRYRIGGIYPIDRDLRQLDIDDVFKAVWKEHLLEFRKRYMESHEWLIIIGGNEGTHEEYLAAREMHVNVFPLPCFGGIGQYLWNKYSDLRRPPCTRCSHQDGSCSGKDISNIIQELTR